MKTVCALLSLALCALPACGGGDDPELVPGGLQPGSPWPMFRGDVRHTGRSAQVGPTAPEIKWSLPSDEGPGSSFSQVSISADGTLYFGTQARRFYAVDGAGELKWVVDVDGEPGSPAIFEDGTIFVSAAELYAFAPDGSVSWSYFPEDPSAGEVAMSPAIGEDGKILVAVEGTGLHAFSANSDIMWVFPCGGSMKSSPAIGPDGTIYIACDDAKLYAVSPSGEQVWTADLADPDQACPVVDDDGRIAVMTYAGTLSVFEPSGGLAWSVDRAGFSAMRQPTLGLDGEIYAQGDDAVYAFDRDGNELWSFPIAYVYGGSPLVDAEGTIYVADGEMLYALEPDGAEKWSIAVGGDSPVMGADGTIYLVTELDGLFAIGEAE